MALNEPRTPIGKGKKSELTIPSSPFLEKLGYGTGIGVYKLERNSMKNITASPWAVKKLLSNKLSQVYGKRLNNEASILRKLSHPNIVGYRGLFKDVNGKKCLAMEQCTSSLGDLIESRYENGLKAYEPKNIFKVAYDIAKALDYLHTQMLLLHGDIKSYNILIKDDFVICKLCDFGTCIPLNSDGSAKEEQAVYIGTVCWSAPEVLGRPQKITNKADMFSLGLVFWEMIALQPPLWSDNLNEEGEIDFNVRTKSRPDIPDEDLGSEYNYILEIFCCCTSELIEQRPSANNLLLILQAMINEKKLNYLLN